MTVVQYSDPVHLMGGQALDELKKYEAVRKEQKKKN